jgi:hypothetical protein
MSEKNEFLEEVPARELPLSTIENTPPLMLDLPDGQQLVVGKLPDGIVIEIATWRGTGRPDSRTNRMMLGVSYDEEEGEEEKQRRSFRKKTKRESEATELVAPVISQEVVEPVEEDVVIPEARIEPAVIEPAVAEPAVSESAVAETIEIEPEVTEPVAIEPEIVAESIESKPVEVDAVQEISILAQAEVPVFVGAEQVETPRNLQDLFGARPRTQIQDVTGSPMLDRGHEIVRKSSKKSISTKSKLTTVFKVLSITASLSLGIFLLVGPAGVRFTLPEGGLSTSLSSAYNAVVIVRESSEYQIGDTVVAAVQAPDQPDYFASIAAQSDTEFVLTENNLYHTTLRTDVKGKVLLVVPGAGFLLHKLGL